MAELISRSIPDLRPMPQGLASPRRGAAVYGSDVVRYRTEGAGSFAGLEYWTTELSFRVGRRLSGIEYLYTPGQAIHDGDRAPRKGSISTEWFGGGWEDRAREFLAEIESGTSEDLVLPAPWGAIRARVFGADVQHDTTLTGCQISFEWEEVGHSDALLWEETPTASSALAAVPTTGDVADFAEATATYCEAHGSPLLTADDLVLLLLEMRTQAVLYVSMLDVFTMDGVLAEEAAALALASAARIFPDGDLLAERWG